MNLRSIVITYPQFHSLPKGVKRMLVISEDFFFSEARTAGRIGPAENSTMATPRIRRTGMRWDQEVRAFLPLVLPAS